jgi:hypothetical protein
MRILGQLMKRIQIWNIYPLAKEGKFKNVGKVERRYNEGLEGGGCLFE